MQKNSQGWEQQGTPDFGEEVVHYGPDLFGSVLVLTLGVATLLASPALGLYFLNLKGQWGFFYGFFVPGILLGAPLTFFGAKMFRIKCILYRHGLIFHSYWKRKPIEFVDIVAVELYLGPRGAGQIRITVSDGSRIWLFNLSNIDDAARQIASSAHVQLMY